jgi:DNA-binding transcriptional LysR family regulator
VRLAELRDSTLLVLASGTGLHEQISAALRERGMHCRLVEYPNAETIKTAVALHMGAAILPASAVQDELRAGTLAARSIADWPGATRVLRLLVRAEGRPPAPVLVFRALLRDQYQSVSGRPSRPGCRS